MECELILPAHRHLSMRDVPDSTPWYDYGGECSTRDLNEFEMPTTGGSYAWHTFAT